MNTVTAGAFTEVQKQYLQGFMAGLVQSGAAPFVGRTSDGRYTDGADAAGLANLAAPASPAEVEPAVHGVPLGELSREERIKYEENALDIWERMTANAEAGRFPEEGDVFRYKFHGLFHTAPTQNALMVRMRIPACELTSAQLRGVAEIAETYGGGYADITTRGNLQVREVAPENAIRVLMKLYDIGLTSRGAGADNVRNITASPTSGFDPLEVRDVRPYARALHHAILNCRDLHGLPRKFNVSFDSGGVVSVAADTNDLGFIAVRVGEGRAVPPGDYFRVQLGGITGHRTFARDCGLLLTPGQCVPVAVAMIRVFIEHGDRTNRKKARLKYLLDRWGFDKFVAATAEKLAFPLNHVPPDQCEPRPAVVRHAHLGVQPQSQTHLRYIGVLTPVGRMNSEQMEALAGIAERYGRGEIRLTVFQNLIIPHVRLPDVEAARESIHSAGFPTDAGAVHGGLVACTGNKGCKYAATDTKGHAIALGDYLRDRAPLDNPINIHLTGCPHSCAQHYCGDIGLLGASMTVGGESVEGYHVVLGGGMDQQQGIGREFMKSVPFTELPLLLERVLKLYLARRRDDETFIEFTRRHEIDMLKAMLEEVAA